jgi:hypothetical protein
MDKVDGPDSDKTELNNLEFFIDSYNPASSSKYIGHFEESIKWLMSFREIKNWMPLKEPSDKTRIIQALLKGQGLSYFIHHLRRMLEAEDT